MKTHLNRLGYIAAVGLAMSLVPGAATFAQTLESTGGGGFTLDSADGAFTGQVGGRLQFQTDTFDDQDEAASNASGTEFRRLRLFAAGTLYDNWQGKVEVDFADDDSITVKDAYLDYTGFSDYGLDDVLVGKTKPPFGLEELTSSKYITFIERNVTSGAISIDERRILTLGGHQGPIHYRIAGYDLNNRDQSDDSDGPDESTSIAGGARVTFAPIHEEGKVLHLGVAGAYEPGNAFDINPRPEAHLADNIDIVTGIDTESDRTKYGGELATVLGPFSLQGEYQRAQLDDVDGAGNDVDVEGYYGFATVFLTGESRPYSVSSGTFGRVKPIHNYGAVELGVRYSRLRNEDGDGELENITGGVNWYIKDNIRLALNYVTSDITDNTGLDRDVDSYLTQLFYDF